MKNGTLTTSAAVPPVIAELWQDFNFSPNDAQRAAILHEDGPLYLPAGPGSGKTRVLLWRTVNLIVGRSVSPEAIFLATFTEKAAHQLREGVRALLGAATNRTGQPYDISRMYVGTVHSHCQRLLGDRRFYPDRQNERPPSLLDDLAQFLLLYRRTRWAALWEGFEGDDFHPDNLNTTLKEFFGGRSASRHQCVADTISLFNRFSEECLDTPALCARDFEPPLPTAMRNLLEVYGRYRALLGEGAPRTDFSLLQQEALRILDGYQGAPVFEHIIIDEYQDTNTVQERLFFALARDHANLCVVGDDDQALYRFRGATVENFVQFPQRCQQHWQRAPVTIPLNINYRSRREIVETYTRFMEWCDWSQEGQAKGRTAPYGGDHFRVPDKGIHAHSRDARPSVVANDLAPYPEAAPEIAAFVKRLLDEGTVENANQIAFLFPSLKTKSVEHLRNALEEQGLKVYAPRAGNFLDVEESVSIFGVLLHLLGKPERGDYGGAYEKYHDWMDKAHAEAAQLLKSDPQLADFVADRRADIARVLNDHALLSATIEKKGWDVTAPYDLKTMRRALSETKGISEPALKSLISSYFGTIVTKREKEGDPFALRSILNRATSLDWNVLDLFYRLCGFAHFKAMFDLAENGDDEGPVCNLGLISQYLSRFMDEYAAVVTASVLREGILRNLLFSSYLYVLHRRGESEFENAEDPFPRGRIPFLTIHQSKGLEFPVVVLGNCAKQNRGPQAVETLVKPLLDREGEPLDRMSEFDIMRMFYVALSRAQNLLVLAHTRGPGGGAFPAFKSILDGDIARMENFDVKTVPQARLAVDELPRNYSFTSDYLLYGKCPRQYMIFRKYNFVPSRSQTMMFGTLVHRTLEDLHQLLIAQRQKADAPTADANNGGTA